ncbi:hypothetical protein ILYODFUR_026437 [Ilyodon furcidens]|uniref:Uncharacterized protein n=1 Tax=Ilyodon furcidens TaxID=33524 RepID=A0ABV0SPD9_9TELE
MVGNWLISISGLVQIFAIILYIFTFFTKCLHINMILPYPFHLSPVSCIHHSLFNPICGFIFASFSLSHTQYLIFSLNPSSSIIPPLIHSVSLASPSFFFLYILLLIYYTPLRSPNPQPFCLALPITDQWNM